MPIVDWFRPKWKRSDPNVRRQAATAMTDQRKLAVLAQEDVDVNVRAAAVKRLNNVEILTAIALSEVNGVISSTAMAGVPNNQDLLCRIAREAKSGSARLIALRKVTSQSLLAECVRLDEDGVIRVAAAEAISDQALIAELVKQSPHEDVRAKLVVKLTNEAQIVSVIRNDQSRYVRGRALALLSDPGVMRELAVNCEDDDIRLALLYKLKDDQLLALIIREDRNATVRRRAAQMIGSPTLCRELIREVGDPELRTELLLNLPDEDLIDVALADTDESVRKAAVRGLRNSQLRMQLALGAPSHLRDLVIQSVYDATLLKRIILESSDEQAQCLAVGQFINPDLLRELMGHSGVPKSAIETRLALLEQWAAEEERARKREAAQAEKDRLKQVAASRRGSNTCAACQGPLRAIIQGRPWVYYDCPECHGEYCNPCVARAGRAHSTASAACPVCGCDLRNYRR